MQVSKPQPVDTRTILRHWLNEGWKYRGFDKLPRKTRQEYKERVEYEFGLMESKDFLDYFAVLGDVVRTAKERGVLVGPARGSAAASLCCFIWRITEVNPMQYPAMLFERFIAPDRNDEPDIDLDFEDERRDMVRQIMIEKYGIERVGNIGTFTRYRGKNAIDDVARVYQIPPFEVNRAKEFLVERSGGDSRFDAGIIDTVEMFPVVKEIFDKYPDLYRSIELEGNYKSFGVHAAGLVIGNDNLDQYVATYAKDVGSGVHKKNVRVLSVDKYDGEHLGLMKLDALGLTTMGMIRNAIDMLDMTLEDLYALPMDDPKVLDAFKRADVMGIFQFEGRTTKMICEQMAPETFMDLAAVNALSRPGPLHSGSTGEYIAIRKGQKPREDIHPMVSKICDFTEGQIIYQEQILQICGDIGKLPWTHRSAIRKIISSKKGESAFNAMWLQFRDGAVSQGIDEHTAAEIWKRMVTAGTYAFNIAHCVSYSMLGFWAMWLKQHHPLEFYAAQLQKTDNRDRMVQLMRDMQDSRYGRSFQVRPPAPGTGMTWAPFRDKNESGVRAGYAQIPGVGESKAIAIEEFEREVGLDDWSDLTQIKGFGPKTVEKIRAFADQPDPFGIGEVRRQIAAIKKAIRDDELVGVPMPRANSDSVPYEEVEWQGVIVGRLKDRNLKDLFEDHRSRTGVDLDPESVKRPDLKDSVTLYLEDDMGTLTVKVNRFNYPKMKEDVWDARVNRDYFIVAAKKYPFLGKTIHAERMWVIEPDD